jgi:hypothetical protein
MQQFSSLLFWRLFTAQHVSNVFPPIIRSSMTAVTASGLTLVSWWQLCCVRGRARPRTQHDCHHDTKVKPEATTAVIELLMMGGTTPETWWALNKRQDNKLEFFLHLVSDLFELKSSTLVVICVVRLLCVLFYVLFVCKCVVPPGDNPTAVNICTTYHKNSLMMARRECRNRE